MAVKVTKRQTADGPRYSITGLTFNQLFRIKNAMFEEEKRMKAIATEFPDIKRIKEDFEGFAMDARTVAIAAGHGCV